MEHAELIILLLILLTAVFCCYGLGLFERPKKIITKKPEFIHGWNPIAHRVLILPEDVKKDLKEKYPGIVIPDNIAEREQVAWNKGTILALGPTAGTSFGGKVFDEHDVRVGDQVLYNIYAGMMFVDEKGRKLRVVNDQDLNMVWKEEEEATDG